METIAGRLVRELERILLKEGLIGEFFEEMALYYKALAQKKYDKDKTYSLHEPEVECVSKGKEHNKYEFGNKVSIVRTWDGLVIGALSFHNEYGGHTIDRSLEQVERFVRWRSKLLAGGWGNRVQKQSDTTEITMPDLPKPGYSYYKKRKKHKLFSKRTGIEPIIGHLKADHRLSTTSISESSAITST